MSKAPIMPLYIDAYLADTMHLTTEEHGALLLLLMAMWRNNGKPLENNNVVLARTVRATPRKWRNLRQTLEAFFQISPEGWQQKRLKKEWDLVQHRVTKRKNTKL